MGERRDHSCADRLEHLLLAHVGQLVVVHRARAERRDPERVSSVVDAAHAPHPMAATASTTMSAIISDLDVDDAAQPEPSDDRHDHGEDQADDPEKIVHERLQVRRLDEPDREARAPATRGSARSPTAVLRR